MSIFVISAAFHKIGLIANETALKLKMNKNNIR